MSNSSTRILYKAVSGARSEAFRLGHSFLAPEHLMLGLFLVEDGIASKVFDELDVDRGALRHLLEGRLPEPEPSTPKGEIPITEAGVSILKDAMAEAEEEGVPYLSTGHLVIALLTSDAWPGATDFSVAELRERIERVKATSSESEDLLSEGELERGND